MTWYFLEYGPAIQSTATKHSDYPLITAMRCENSGKSIERLDLRREVPHRGHQTSMDNFDRRLQNSQNSDGSHCKLVYIWPASLRTLVWLLCYNVSHVKSVPLSDRAAPSKRWPRQLALPQHSTPLCSCPNDLHLHPVSRENFYRIKSHLLNLSICISSCPSSVITNGIAADARHASKDASTRRFACPWKLFLPHRGGRFQEGRQPRQSLKHSSSSASLLLSSPSSILPPPPWADRPSSLVVTVLSGFFGPPRRPQSVPPAMTSQKSVRLNCFHSRHSTASFRESPDPPCCFEQLLTAAC